MVLTKSIQLVVLLLILSSFLFPSLLNEYSISTIFGTLTNRKIVLGVNFVVDELVVLFGIMVLWVYVLDIKKIKLTNINKIYIIFFLYLLISFIFDYYFRDDNVPELVLRNRWILLNSLYFLVPAVAYLSNVDLYRLFKRYNHVVFTLVSIKLFSVFMPGTLFNAAVFKRVGPEIAFFANLFCLSTLILSRNIFWVLMAVLLSGITAALSSQTSAMLHFLFSVFIGVWSSGRLKGKAIPVGRLSLFLILAAVLFVKIKDEGMILNFVSYFGLNPLDFLQTNISGTHLVDLWIEAIREVFGSFFSILFGRGIGHQLVSFGIPFSESGRFLVSENVLMHNAFVTMLYSFGLVGLILFAVIIKPVFHGLKTRIKTCNETDELYVLIQSLILSVLLYSLSTPVIWKLRTGVILWLLLGLFYAVKNRQNETAHTELKQ